MNILQKHIHSLFEEVFLCFQLYFIMTVPVWMNKHSTAGLKNKINLAANTIVCSFQFTLLFPSMRFQDPYLEYRFQESGLKCSQKVINWVNV